MRELVVYQLAVLASVTDPAELNPNVIIPSALTVLGVVAAALIAARYTGRRRAAPPADETPPSTSPLAAFSGTQNEFMSLVIKDNDAVRAEVTALRGEVASLRVELDASRASHGAFERAVRRYLEQLAAAWTGTSPMPWPEGPDHGLLERTLPRRARSRAQPE